MKHITNKISRGRALNKNVFKKYELSTVYSTDLNVQTEQAVESSSLIENIFSHKTLLTLF